ncbi:hypothetical protein IMSAGC005_03513 [Lachnospiraceae bacterium]|nr:hypothetical protein IMSAGC005_03513 [Lachnospiraceae bacterium]
MPYKNIPLIAAMIEIGILTQKSFDDCQHIGVAIINECDCIIHIVNVKTIRGVRAIQTWKDIR